MIYKVYRLIDQEISTDPDAPFATAQTVRPAAKIVKHDGGFSNITGPVRGG
jgi:hypothetical protein|tara:strand:- start:6 stop:158 length:153 start_codon:yes stop_codon:yes gene_type:complete